MKQTIEIDWKVEQPDLEPTMELTSFAASQASSGAVYVDITCH